MSLINGKTLTFFLVLNNAQGTVVLVWWPFIDALFKNSCLSTDRLVKLSPSHRQNQEIQMLFESLLSQKIDFFFFLACFLPDTRKAKLFISISGVKRLMSPLRRQPRLQKWRCKNVEYVLLPVFLYTCTQIQLITKICIRVYVHKNTHITDYGLEWSLWPTATCWGKKNLTCKAFLNYRRGGTLPDWFTDRAHFYCSYFISCLLLSLWMPRCHTFMSSEGVRNADHELLAKTGNLSWTTALPQTDRRLANTHHRIQM